MQHRAFSQRQSAISRVTAGRLLAGLVVLVALTLSRPAARAEAMLQLFNVNWSELTQKMPEIAEAGYTSLWLPPPSKAGSVFSVGYDLFDPFDLGDKDQRGTVRTRYGTKAELLELVATAHRFGIRVYFDNIMNHRGFDVPGYTLNTPTNLYPGLTVQDFHLRRQADGTYRNWDVINNYQNLFEVQNRPLFGLLDLANEPGGVNYNFGLTEGNTTNKISFLRQPGFPQYYMDTNLPTIAGPWRPFNSTNGDPVVEDLGAYLIRSAMWILAETRCDGFRLDAVKHTPSTFFGDTSATTAGYTGGIQTMYDYVHGFGTNGPSLGYVEGDNNRNSCFDTEATRNDAMLFGEHLGEPPSYQEYLDRGMRLLNTPYHFELNNKFGNPSASLAGMEQRDYTPGYGFSGRISVLFAQSHDDNIATHRELHNGYNFFREGLPCIYSDGYNQSGPPDYFPKVASAPYLGQFGDQKMPDLAYLHHQLARGGTRPRWGDADIVAFERYDYRDGGSDADQTVVLFAMNDNYGFPGDVAFVDGEGESFPAGVNTPPGAGGDAQGIAVGFPPGSVLVQLATTTPGYDRTYKQSVVRAATNSRAAAQASGGSTVYVGGQSIPPGGGAIEILVPSGGYVAYGYQWPEASRASLKDAITFRQNGAEPLRMTVLRKDGVNGDSGFNPVYPFKMRGSINPDGSVAGGQNVTNKTYAIDVPVLTNAPFDIVVRADASTVNTLLKLDGGVDLNSHLGLGPTNSLETRDNRPGAASDVYLGYEQSQFFFRNGPEKFAAKNVSRNNVTSAGAETYRYTVGGTNLIVNGSGNGPNVDTQTADWVYHDPAAPNTTTNAGTATQRLPFDPSPGQAVDLYVKVGYQFTVSKCVVYYTTDGTNPEGSFGVGTGTTKVVTGSFYGEDDSDDTIDWWKATIPGADNQNGTQIRYKIALYKSGISQISDSDSAKRFGLNEAGITNFNPTTATVWLHNNRNTNDIVTGLQEGFHIMRSRVFLPRTNKSSVYNTFAQTFYYDAAPPDGVVAFPVMNGATLTSATYDVVIRADSSATSVEVNVIDDEPNNDDIVTGFTNGNGLSNGVPVFAPAALVAPNAGLNAAYPALPQEYRYTYSGVASSGTATITVRIKEMTTSIYTNRLLTLVRTVNVAAPVRTLYFSTPPTNVTINVSSTNELYNFRVCNTTVSPETETVSNYTFKVNGVAVSPASLILSTSAACGGGYNSLVYRWSNIPAGTNLIEAIYNGSVLLSDSRIVVVTYPPPPNVDSDGDGMSDAAEAIAGTDPNDPNSVLKITELEDGSQLVVWDSVSNINYQVLATTSLTEALAPISPVIQASGPTTFYYDSTPASEQKYYRIQVIP